MAFVLFVTFDSNAEMSKLKVSKSISQKTTLPPKCSITFAVDIQVKAGTIASSSGPKPNAANER